MLRQSKSVPIIHKIWNAEGNETANLSSMISSRKPFGLPTNYKPSIKGVPCWFTQKQGLQFARNEDVVDKLKIINKWKLLIPPAPIAGQTDFSKPITFYYEGNVRIAKPGECCTESWLVACAFETEAEVLSFKSFLLSKLFRFLLLQTVVSQLHPQQLRKVFSN